jgi:hypothetical protein
MSETASAIAQPAGIVTVGVGRGFVVKAGHRDLVITAAHCLPKQPEPDSFDDAAPYQDLLGRIGEVPTVWARCRFADPVSDIAVLESPDGQEFDEQFEDYQALIDSVVPFSIADPPIECQAWLYSLDGRWFPCRVGRRYGPIWIFEPAEAIVRGMSGSPIRADDGSAIGVVRAGNERGSAETGIGPQPVLTRDLPARLRDELLPGADRPRKPSGKKKR